MRTRCYWKKERKKVFLAGPRETRVIWRKAIEHIVFLVGGNCCDAIFLTLAVFSSNNETSCFLYVFIFLGKKKLTFFTSMKSQRSVNEMLV